MAAVLLHLIVFTVGEDLPLSWIDWIDLFMYLPVTAGLLGFVYQVRVGWLPFWRVFAPCLSYGGYSTTFLRQ